MIARGHRRGFDSLHNQYAQRIPLYHLLFPRPFSTVAPNPNPVDVDVEMTSVLGGPVGTSKVAGPCSMKGGAGVVKEANARNGMSPLPAEFGTREPEPENQRISAPEHENCNHKGRRLLERRVSSADYQ